MSKPKVYVDGQEGTTGLRIHEHLAGRSDVDVLRIEGEKRKDPAERRRMLNAADVAILCLPEAASREAVGMIDSGSVRVIDASTAFRVEPGWVYGLPELEKGGGHRVRIAGAKRVCVPGCHASAFLLGVAPLVAAGIVSREAVLTCFSVTGYSGGGRKMIAAYEENPPAKLKAPRHYALKLTHKHLPEMRRWAALTHAPLFTPVVCNVHSGMAVEVFLPPPVLAKKVGPAEVREALAAHYSAEKFVRVMPWEPDAALDEGSMDIMACNGTNRADVFVVGNAGGDGQMAVITRLDNLGKGASGAAVQCLNLMLGVEEAMGLEVDKMTR